jgi:hypothetical protein
MRPNLSIPRAISAGLASLAVTIAIFASGALAEEPCSGHQLLPKPRPEASCRTVAPQTYPSPDKALIATVLPVDVSLYAPPDMGASHRDCHHVEAARSVG